MDTIYHSSTYIPPYGIHSNNCNLEKATGNQLVLKVTTTKMFFTSPSPPPSPPLPPDVEKGESITTKVNVPLLGFDLEESDDTTKIVIHSSIKGVRRTIIGVCTPALIAGLFVSVPFLVSKVNPYVVLLSQEEFDLVKRKFPDDIRAAEQFASCEELSESLKANEIHVDIARAAEPTVSDIHAAKQSALMKRLGKLLIAQPEISQRNSYPWRNAAKMHEMKNYFLRGWLMDSCDEMSSGSSPSHRIRRSGLDRDEFLAFVAPWLMKELEENLSGRAQSQRIRRSEGVSEKDEMMEEAFETPEC